MDHCTLRAWRALCLGIIFTALVAGTAFAEEISVEVIEVDVSNDFPIGVYQEKSQYNLGGSLRFNSVIHKVSWLQPFLVLDNNYWILSPSWIESGTQLNAMVGIGCRADLGKSPAGDSFDLGLGIAYGLMFHSVMADTNDSGATLFTFFDQAVGADLDFGMRFAKSQVGLVVRGRYLFSPESNSEKHQVGALIGLRLYLNADRGQK